MFAVASSELTFHSLSLRGYLLLSINVLHVMCKDRIGVILFLTVLIKTNLIDAVFYFQSTIWTRSTQEIKQLAGIDDVSSHKSW